ncbi:golgin subfamily A member 5-like [Ptychodera flava]|uniref:golgin subfamily A member 5-like n=1 Tax=Ptychodera flava TaxID=63121 RepID=UPI00396A975F
MAWLLGKAEDLLNKMDQQTSEVLNQDMNVLPTTFDKKQASQQSDVINSQKKSVQPQDLQAAFINKSVSTGNLATYLANTSNVKRTNATDNPLNQPKTAAQSPFKSAKSFQPKPKKGDDDEKLFAFLNSPDSLSTERKEKKKGNGRHSRQSSTSSTTSTRSARTDKTDNVSNAESVGITISLDPSADDHTDGSDSAVGTDVTDSTQNPTSDQQQGNIASSHSQQLSSLELENKLLKNEVSSLNQEMASVVQRAKSAQQEVSRLRSQINSRSSQITESDGIIRQLRNREEDLMEALSAKDSQLAVLRVRLEDADKELKAKREVTERLQTENERILKDHDDSSGIQGQALDSLREKLHESEAALRREQEAYKSAQAEAMARQNKLEQEHRSLAESLTSFQQKYNSEKGHSHELSVQLKTAKSNLESVKTEMNDYKQKATRILQSKDKLINSLKEANPSLDKGTVSEIELEELHQDRDNLKEELQQANMKIENLRSEMQDLEFQSQTDSDIAQEQIQDLEQQLSDGKRQVKEVETELAEKSDELKYLQQEQLRQKTNFQVRLQDREDEIQKLRHQLTTKTMSTTTQSELENRLHALTESLIQKQTMLETLSTEKNSLVVQLERLEKQSDEAEAIKAIRNHTHTVTMEESEEGIRQRNMPTFLYESPGDTGVTRSMKVAANTLDRFSVRLGIFLRRYPIARLFVIFYMILLHVWVMIVLLTYSPEMHGTDYQPGSEPREHNP